MKKLSLVTLIAIQTAAFAGGVIEAPTEDTNATGALEIPATSTTCNKSTTINSKAQLYYYTHDTMGKSDLFKSASSSAAGTVTFDITHHLTDNITANFSILGYANAANSIAEVDFEGKSNGAILNVANITATLGDTTLIAGRQLIDSPMFGSFDWLLAPSAFEAYTLVNQSISNLTLVGTYVRTIRPNNSGDAFINLRKKGDGNHFALGAAYGTDTFKSNVWYYNIDIANYTQVYADFSYDFTAVDIAAQVVSTKYDKTDDSIAYGVKVGTTVAGIDVSAAVSNISDNPTGYVERDSLYTSSWNTMASTAGVAKEDTLSWKVSASTNIANFNTEISYAAYGDEGSELDVILGYDINKCINLAAIYSSTDYDLVKDTADVDNALELIATYSF